MMSLLLVLLCLLVWPSHSVAATKYARPTSCSDAGSGTEGSPYCTINTCLRNIGNGGTCYLRGGTYVENINSNDYAGSSFPTGSSWSSPTTLASYPGETATIRGPGGGDMINLPQSYIHYIIFDRLVLDAANYGNGISFGSGGAHHLRFSNGQIKNAIHNGMLIEGTGNELLNSRFDHNGTDSALDHGVYWTGNDGLIDGNVFDNNKAYGLHLFDGTNGDVNNNIVRNNRIHHNMGQGGATLSRGTGTLFYNNVVYANGLLGVQVSSNSTNQQLYNNTVVHNRGPGILIKPGQAGTILRNNIVFGNSGTPIDNQGSGTQFSLSDNVTSDPRFVNPDPDSDNFQVHDDSPAVNAGMNLSSMFQRDCAGAARPGSGAWTAGAYQSGGTLPPALPVPTNLRGSTAP